MEEPKENINPKVSNEVFTTESIIISTTLLNTEPFTEIITTSIPTSAAVKNSETTTILIPITEQINDNKSVTNIPISISKTINNTLSTIKTPVSTTKNIINTINSTRAPTSTITNVITSIYEAATERQKVRVKNIQNFLLEHKKTEPVTHPITWTTPLTTIPSTTIENVISVEEPTQKSILKGRFGGQAQFRPTLKKSALPPEIKVTTEKLIETTTNKNVDTTTEKKFRLNKYVSRFSRPTHYNKENTSTTDEIFTRTTTTESILESSTRQFNRFKLTTSSNTNNNTSLPRRSFSRFSSSTSETPSTSSITEIQKSRYFRSRKPILSTSTPTSTITTEVTTNKEVLNSEENSDTINYETTTYIPTTINFPTINYEETSYDDESKITTTKSFETTKYVTNKATTIQPTTINMARTFRGSIRARNASEDSTNEKSRSSSRGRENSRFLKNEQKILYIRVLPSPDGRTQNEFTTNPVKNITRNRGRIKAFDSLELNTLNDGLTNDDRPHELFRGSETKFRVQQSINESTEEV